MDSEIKYWRQDDRTQNFGDFLSEYFARNLFFESPPLRQTLRIVGSCIDDMFVPPEDEEASEQTYVFWGCGLRAEGGLSESRRERVSILAVRGPLTRSALRLGASIPIGDPGLLLPALHKTAALVRPTDATLLVPHFHEQRGDKELRSVTGCDEILRPNIPRDMTSIMEFIERVVAAPFVLAGSLHGAIVAAAYGRPFAFWESGAVDLPFKWHDFAASLGIPCTFSPDIESARAAFAEYKDALRIPVLWPLLVASPLPVRPDAFASVLALDIQRHGIAALDAKVSSFAANDLQAKLRQWSRDVERIPLLLAEAESWERRERELRGERDAENARLTEAAAEIETLRHDLHRLRVAKEEHDRTRMQLEDESTALAAKAQHQAEQAALLRGQVVERDRQILEAETRVSWLASEEARLHEVISQRDLANAALAAELASNHERDRQILEAKTGVSWLASEEARLHEAILQRDLANATLAAELASNHERDRKLLEVETRVSWLASEEARLHEAVLHRDLANAALAAELASTQRQLAGMFASRSWRLTAPVRGLTNRDGRLAKIVRRVARLAWWSVSFQLSARLRQRRLKQKEIRGLIASPLFDADFYLEANPHAGTTRRALVEHYVFAGFRDNLAPSPFFDEAWYRRGYMDDGAEISGLWHYITLGAAEGADPHPIFESSWYAAQHPDASHAPSPLEHYLSARPNAGPPTRWFDTSGYLSEHPEIAAAAWDPVEHYLRHGAAKGFDPHALFDTDWYLATYPEAVGSNPLGYYLRTGESAGHYPSALVRETGIGVDVPLALPTWENPEISIVVPVFGQLFDTLRCLFALMTNTGSAVSFETIVIDDNPTNQTAHILGHIPGLRIEANPKNLGFLKSCNRAATLVCGWHIVFLNNDATVHSNWLEPLVSLVRNDPTVGIVGCKLLNRDGTIQEAGGVIYDDGWGYSFGRGEQADRSEFNYLREVDVVTGAAFLVRRELFTMVGGFDERYAPAYYEEFDLAFMARASGYKVLYQPLSVVTHLGSSTYGSETRDMQSRRNHAQFCVKWERELTLQPSRDADLFFARQRDRAAGAVLMIDDKVPEYDRHAGGLTIFQYARLLQQLELRVIFAPADRQPREPYGRILRERGIEVISGGASLSDWLTMYGRSLTAIWTARPDITAPILTLLRSTSNAPVLYYPHDLHYVREMRRYKLEGNLEALSESNRLKRIETKIFNAVDFVLTPSSDEAEVIRGHAPGTSVRTIPPYIYPPGAGANLDQSAFASRKDILFVGGFKHPPNVDAAMWLLTEIMPMVWRVRPDVKVMIVGDSPDERLLDLASERVEVTGYVPELSPFYARARLSIAPLRYGAGVKGKIVSSLQAGIPVVTTNIGNEGIALQDGVEVLLGETPDELAVAALSLLESDRLCAELSSAGHEVIDRRFSERWARAAISEILNFDRCRVCGNVTHERITFSDSQDGPWSEQLACKRCLAPNRTVALVNILLATIQLDPPADLIAAVPLLDNRRIHEFSTTGPVCEILSKCRLFTCSEYLDGVVSGDTSAAGTMCEDLQALTFRDDEFDYLISQDVFGHLPDIDRAFAETFRVLRPGGRHIFTVPFTGDRASSLIRDDLRDGSDDQVLSPPLYGDPFRSEGARAFRESGSDMLHVLRSIGFKARVHEIVIDEGTGAYVVVVDAVKPI